MQVVTPPNKIPEKGIEYGDPVHLFLAGSIEMGAAELWQDRFIEMLGERNVVVLNPRRSDWDSSWEQNLDCKPFVEQVKWELSGIADADADAVVFYFDPNTKSPITLAELGLVSDTTHLTREIYVVCPEGFWRKGNVDIMSIVFGHIRCNSFEEVIRCLDVAWSINC